MSEMVERVARALAAKDAERFGKTVDDPDEWHLFTRDARAAIEAMREPTQEMLGAGNWYDEDEGGYPAPSAVWEAMIDAALKSQAQGVGQ